MAEGSELGWGAGGMADAMQLMQTLQTGQIENKQKQVELESSTLQLDNLKKLQASLGGQAFQSAMGSGDPNQQNKALTDLATTYLADGFPQQAAAVTHMATEMATTRATVTAKQAEDSVKYITMAEDVFSNVSNSKEWSMAQQFMQSQLPPDALANPRVKALLTMGYSPDLVKVLPGYFDHLKTQAQLLKDQAAATADDARARHYGMEDELIKHQEQETDARRDHLTKEGGGDLAANKQDVADAANDLQAQFPEAEAEPIVQGGKMPDATATRSNYKARLNSAAQRVAELAKLYVKQGKAPDEARRQAIVDVDQQHGLDMLKPVGGTKPKSTAPASPNAPANSSADGWGDPEAVK
jgi:hypothetical protein